MHLHLHLQPTDNSSKTGATGTPPAPSDDSGNSPPPRPVLSAPTAFLLNIPCNKYKGPNYSTQCFYTTLDTDSVDQLTNPLDLKALDIKSLAQPPLPTSSRMASLSSNFKSPWPSQKNT
ncbi:hypothetical protein C0993_005638 [Termitomyces sp. T159_Od127]|nr:hypothetical protein C0993_005638 [Termitomyces sp. T159_Od127]